MPFSYGDVVSVGHYIGTATSAGVVVSYFTLIPHIDGPAAIDADEEGADKKLAQCMEQIGRLCIPLVEYSVPEMLQQHKG